jgi:hypothetical protein
MKEIIHLAIIFLAVTHICMAQDVMQLFEGESPGKGTLEELHWLTGYWKRTGLGGYSDEIWMPAVDNSMSGIFRFVKDGVIGFTEYLVIQEIDESLVLRLKHYNRDLSPWEEKDKWVEFKLIKIEEQTAWFNGLTYHRHGDELIIKLTVKSGERSWIEEFRFIKSDVDLIN